MRKYYHLLTLGRSKGLSLSNKGWVNETRAMKSHISITRCSGISAVSHANESSLTSNYHHDFPLNYQVTLKGRDVISAALAPVQAHEHSLPLSNLDILLPPIEAGVFFCYKKKDNLAMSPEAVVKTMKKSLAGVLSTFYPLAGEIVPNSQEVPEVLCNNGGVEFVHAHADVELENLDLHHPDKSVKEKLVPRVNRGVLSVQVTELNCGAIVISCAFDHRVADGHSLNMFLVAWAEFARFKPISNMPSFRPSILNPRRPTRYDTSFNNLYIPLSLLPPQSSIEDQLHSRIYYIVAESIDRLQDEASSGETRRSKLLSFTAFFWKLLAQGGTNDANRTSRMGVVVSGRKFLTLNTEEQSFSLESHFGNVLSIPYGEAQNHDLKTMSLSEVARKVHGFVSKATQEEHFRGLIDWVESHRREPVVARIKLQETDDDAVVVSSGQGLPIEDMDFGWGRPEFGSFHLPWGGQTGYIITMPSARKNGDWVVYGHLKQKHLDLIERKTPHVFKPFTNSYLRF